MQPPDIARWVVHHLVALMPFGRPDAHVADLDASQQAVKRADRVIDTWNQRIADGEAIRTEREFWEQARSSRPKAHPDDG